MAVTINADTSNGVIITPDTSGEINFQSSGSTITSITANGIDVTGDFTVDTNTLYVDSTNNRVGIGNSNPMPSESRTITIGTKTVIGDVVSDQSLFGNNIYYNSGWKYYNTGGYSAIRLQNGAITFHTGASGSAGGSAGSMDTTDLRLEIANGGYSIFTQRSTHQGSQNVGTLRTATGSLGGLEIYGGGGANAAFMAFHRPGAYASYFGLDTDNWFAVGGWSAGAGLHAFKCGAFSKTSGSFKIDHPLPELNETHNLVHSFVESPQANNIYRGKVELVNGQATVNLDTVSTMTEGTFVALNRDIHCYTSNETDWDAVKGSVNGNILTIQCQNENSTATVSWLVIGERQDQHMYDTDWTDENGKVIVEPLKTQSAITSQVPMDEEQEAE
jgi:hypothetical protein